MLPFIMYSIPIQYILTFVDAGRSLQHPLFMNYTENDTMVGGNPPRT